METCKYFECESLGEDEVCLEFDEPCSYSQHCPYWVNICDVCAHNPCDIMEDDNEEC